MASSNISHFRTRAFCCIFIEDFFLYILRTALPLLTVVAVNVSSSIIMVVSLISTSSGENLRRKCSRASANKRDKFNTTLWTLWLHGIVGRWKYRLKTDKWTRLAGSRFNRDTYTGPSSQMLQQRHVFRGNPRSPVFNKQRRADIVQARPGQICNKGHSQIQEPNLTSVMQKFNLFQSPGSIVR